MSNEIRVNANITVENGDYKDSWQHINQRYDQSVIGATGGIVPVSSGAITSVSMGSVTSPGFTVLHSLSDTANFKWGLASGASTLHQIGLIKPGEPALFRLPTLAANQSLGLQATGASGYCEYQVWSD